ncbi:MAG TPA: hypothetical protein DCM27_00705 [Rhodospirillaceae bacterium]|nr:hypothetical protein [Rhodospirillaceae bacterium]
MSFVFTSSLQKCLPTLSSPDSSQNWEKIVADFITQSQNETVTLISRFDRNIEILEHQKNQALLLVSILEEAGGLTVRARNLMSTPEDIQKYAEKIKEFENWFDLTRSKFDKASADSAIDGINLMDGGRLETVLDAGGKNKLVTEGIALTCAALGIRPPDFSTLYSLQNARIDVMNALDIVITVKNTIAAHIINLTINRDFALQAIELVKISYAKLGTTNAENEMSALLKLGDMGESMFGGEKMAETAQQDLLNSFKSSPNMEDI